MHPSGWGLSDSLSRGCTAPYTPPVPAAFTSPSRALVFAFAFALVGCTATDAPNSSDNMQGRASAANSALTGARPDPTSSCYANTIDISGAPADVLTCTGSNGVADAEAYQFLAWEPTDQEKANYLSATGSAN